MSKAAEAYNKLKNSIKIGFYLTPAELKAIDSAIAKTESTKKVVKK